MNSARLTVVRLLRVWPTFALGLLASVLHADDPARSAPPPGYTAEQQTALDTLDRVIARFAALLGRDDDARHKTATAAVLDGFRQRRAALGQTFDQSRCDELRVDLNLEYQRLASWMAPPTTPPPPGPAADRRQK